VLLLLLFIAYNRALLKNATIHQNNMRTPKWKCLLKQTNN